MPDRLRGKKSEGCSVAGDRKDRERTHTKAMDPPMSSAPRVQAMSVMDNGAGGREQAAFPLPLLS